jgi:hypothetical protein
MAGKRIGILTGGGDLAGLNSVITPNSTNGYRIIMSHDFSLSGPLTSSARIRSASRS